MLELVKNKLGILGDSRDSYLLELIEQAKKELEYINGVRADESNGVIRDYICDLVVWKFKEKGAGERPKWLASNLRDLMIKETANGSN